MRSGRHFAILGIAALVATGIAFFVVGQGDKETKDKHSKLVLPALAAQLDRVTTIHIAHSGGGYSLSKQDGQWLMDSYDGFPADAQKTRKILAGLARMTRLEKKTNNPARHDRLQLQDPAMDSAASIGLRLEDDQGNSLAAFITGKITRPAEGSKPARFYLRLDGDNQAWLVEATAALPDEEKAWIDLDKAKLARDRTKIARLTHPDGDIVEVSRADKKDADFVLQGIPTGFKAKSDYIANSLGSAMSWPSLEHPAKLSGSSEVIANGYFESFDGLVIETEALKLEDGSQAVTISAQALDKAKQAEADAINALTQGWMFRVPDHKIEDFTRKLSYFIEPASEASQESE